MHSCHDALAARCIWHGSHTLEDGFGEAQLIAKEPPPARRARVSAVHLGLLRFATTIVSKGSSELLCVSISELKAMELFHVRGQAA